MWAQQIFTAVYQKGLNDFENLTTIPLEMRKIKENIYFNKSKIIETHESKDGTIKFLVELSDTNKIECVYIPKKLEELYVFRHKWVVV